MLTGFVSTFIAVGASVAAQSLSSSSPSVVCAAGQCLQGFSNLTIGAKLSAPGAATDIHLLPGQYFTNTNPQLLHNVLTTNGATLTPSAGFANANASSSSSTTALSLPLNLALQPGIATFTELLFGGQTAFIPVGNTSANSSTPLSALSLTLSANTFALVSSSSGSVRTVIWDPIPDIAQLPTSALSGSLSLLSLQSASCSPSCSGSATCSASGTCVCPAGFTGSSCESCAPGFFGPNCSACPADCDQCDDGISGTGRCLKNKVANEPATCGCLNGVCGSGGTCACNEGWTTSANGTQCAKCAPGFFSTSNGDCKVCQLGCAQCADVSGDCITCKQSFTQSTLDPTTCNPPSTSTQTTSGTPCPSGSFSNGTACVACSPLCQTCTGATSNDCVVCGSGRVAFNGSCVSTDSNGVCEGTQLVADNNKRECDSCPAKCTTCGIPNFNVASTINQLQCTGCLPGFVLSNGQCVASCPSGTFLSPSDNLTCTACDSSCSTCAGSSTFCLTCSSGLLASAGKCTSTCPSNTFSSSGSCISCHPDCATCTGGSFTQCASCPSSRPVLSNGRCLPTCAKNQFFDPTSGSCQSCDSSCASCSGSGPSSCLSCSNASGEVLRGGTCVAANCSSQTSVLASLGVCLSDLIVVPQASASGTVSTSLPPLPTISGLTNPTVVTNDNSSSGKLQWWQILLMTLGCAFIFLVFLMLWRRRARMQRKKRTEAFAAAKNLGGSSWRARLARFGEKFFGHRLGAAVLRRGGGNGGGGGGKNRGGGVEEYALPSYESDSSRLLRMRMEEQQRHEREMDTLLNAYEHSLVVPKSNDASGNKTKLNKNAMNPSHLLPPRFHSSASSSSSSSHSTNHLSDASLYSQITGLPRRTAEPRRPIKDFTPPPVPIVPNSRFSMTTYEGSYYPPQAQLRARTPDRGDRDRSRAPTPAEEYAKSVITRSNSPQPQYPYQQQGSTPYYTAAQHQQLQQQRSLIDLDFDAPAPMLYPNNTGNTTVSRNPFRP